MDSDAEFERLLEQANNYEVPGCPYCGGIFACYCDPVHKYQRDSISVCGVPLSRFYALTWNGTTCPDCLARPAVIQE